MRSSGVGKARSYDWQCRSSTGGLPDDVGGRLRRSEAFSDCDHPAILHPLDNEGFVRVMET